MDKEGFDGKYNFVDSAVEAFSLSNLLKRVFLLIIFGIILGLKQLIANLDEVGRMGGGFFKYLSAMSSAMWYGVVVSLGSMWSVIVNPTIYLSTHSWGSIGFAIFSLVVLIMFFYQPISLLINVVDGKRGHATGTALRIFVSFIVVMILSCIMYYLGGQQQITTLVDNLTISNITATIPTNFSNSSEVINLL